MGAKTYQATFPKLVILLIIGLLIGQKINLTHFPFLIFALIICSLFVVYLTRLIWNVDKRFVVNILMSFATILLGFSCYQLKAFKTNTPTTFQAQNAPYIIQISTSAKETNKTFRYLGKIIKHPNSSLFNETVIVYVSKQFTQPILPNSQLLAKGIIQRIPPPKNPNTFDYQHFMDKKDIHFQTFLSEKSILNITESEANQKTWIETMRNHCQFFISKFVSKNQQGIAQALLIGNKTELDQTTQTSFQRAGTTHILAVSGLHVGIIYIILQFFLRSFSKKVRLPKWLILVILVVGIWAFVLVTGAKPSTIRAGFMFTLFGIGRLIRPNLNSINVLAAVAFFMLCVNPYYLTDVGFQLSFSAVAGILLFQPFVRLFLTRYKIINYFISISLISVIAQLSTIPFVIFYFHNTPLLGVFANLVAIPAAFVIVSCGFLGIITAKLPFLPIVFGKIVSYAIELLDQTNQWISQFNFAAIEHFQIQPIQAFLLCFCFFACLLHFRNRSKWLLYSALLAICFFFGLEINAFVKAKHQSNIFIYSLSNNLVIDIQKGRTSYLLHHKPIDPNDSSFTIQANHKVNRISHIKQYNLNEHSIQEDDFIYRNGMLQLNDKAIQIINKKTKTIYNKADYFIGFPLKTKTINQLKDSISAPLIIHHKYYKKQEKDSSTIHNLAQDGAYVIN